MYDTALSTFNNCRRSYRLEENWPPRANELADFVSYLSYKQFSPSTVKSYISGISYFCKLHNLQDPTQSFLLRKILVGLSRKYLRTDDRKPITPDILSSLLRLLPAICKSPYESKLFSAMFTTAFFGYFRMGELVQNTVLDPGHAIQVEYVTYHEHSDTVQIFLKHSKTDQEGKGTIITLSSTQRPPCPVHTMRSFICLRPKIPGAFFCPESRKPVTRYQVTSVFNMALDKLGLDTRVYKTHSFRIGVAYSTWAMGTSKLDIAQRGRWKSHCMFNYIRE